VCDCCCSKCLDAHQISMHSGCTTFEIRHFHLQVVVRLLVAPYGNAGVSTDPEEQESNYQTHPPERVRRAPVDDLMGMVREPSDDPEKGEIRAVATTDQMELQVSTISSCCHVSWWVEATQRLPNRPSHSECCYESPTRHGHQ
jgi:hypothetical protein